MTDYKVYLCRIKYAEKNNFNRISLENNLFRVFFFDMVAADPDALFASLCSLPKGRGKVNLGYGPDDPLPVLLEAFLGQREVSQVQLPVLYPGSLFMSGSISIH